ncbi:hypothetical protein PO909_022146 [Leuciscus waleckii]
MSEKQPRKEGKGGKKKDKDSSSPEAEPKLKDLRSVTVQDGKKTVFKCQIVAGNPVPSLKWYKNGQELTGKNKPKSIKIKERKNFVCVPLNANELLLPAQGAELQELDATCCVVTNPSSSDNGNKSSVHVSVGRLS